MKHIIYSWLRQHTRNLCKFRFSYHQYGPVIAKFLWVVAAALGNPVVPLVDIKNETVSSGSKSVALQIDKLNEDYVP